MISRHADRITDAAHHRHGACHSLPPARRATTSTCLRGRLPRGTQPGRRGHEGVREDTLSNGTLLGHQGDRLGSPRSWGSPVEADPRASSLASAPACALTGNRPGNLLVRRRTPNQLSPAARLGIYFRRDLTQTRGRPIRTAGRRPGRSPGLVGRRPGRRVSRGPPRSCRLCRQCCRQRRARHYWRKDGLRPAGMEGGHLKAPWGPCAEQRGAGGLAHCGHESCPVDHGKH